MSVSKAENPSGRSGAAIPWEYVEAYTFRAAELFQAGDAKGAAVALERVLSMDPGNESALLMRGIWWFRQGRVGKAIRDLSNALVRNSRNTAAYYKRGEVHQLRGHFRAAIADYSRVLLLEPDHREALVNRAVLCLHLKQVDRALADFDRLMAGDSRVARALAHWGVKRSLGIDR